MAISLLTMFNAVSLKDKGSHRVANGLPYGPDDRQRLDIYAPRDLKGEAPVVFFIYGGSWQDGDRRNYGFAGRALAALGYVTVVADYRLVPEVEYPGFLDDCALALDWVVGNIARYGGDAQAIALMGHSAGAYNAAMLVLDPAYLTKRGLLGNVRCLVGLSGPYDFLPFDGQISLRVFGAVPNPRMTQPINHVGSTAPTMFLASGDRDQLVSPRNSIKLAAALREQGVAVVERHYERLDHAGTLLALARPTRHLAPLLSDVAVFLADNLVRDKARLAAVPA